MYLLLCKMPSKKERDDDDFVPSGGAAARGAKKHPVTEAVLRFAIEKRGPKAGPFVNKVFEQSIEGAEEEATTIEGDDDDARAAPERADHRHLVPAARAGEARREGAA